MDMAARATMGVSTGVSARRERKMQADNNDAPTYRTIQASEFEAKCLELVDEVAESGEEIVITKEGRPVSRLIPYREKQKKQPDAKNIKRAETLFGINKEKIKIHGDIVAPLDVEWYAESGRGWDDLL